MSTIAKIKGLTIEIGGNTIGLNKALAEVNKSTKSLKTELRDVERLLKLDPGNTELLAQKHKVLSENVAKTKEKLDTLREAERQAQEQFKQGKIGEEQYRAIQREVIKAEEEIKKMNKQIKETDWNHIAGSLDKFGKKSVEVGKSLTTKVTLPILGIGAAAAKIGMDFEQSMSKVKAMSGATDEEMQRLEQAARDAGAATSKSAKDAADGLTYMALAGWDVNKSIDGLMPVLRLSEAGNIDLARASSLVTDSMAAMGIEVQDLESYLDVVAQTARSSNTDIDQMAEAYIGVGGTLRGLNVPIEESAIALGMLANAGIKGSEAGTGLNAILMNMTAPTGRAKKALDDLSYSAFDSEGNFKGLETVLFELKGKFAGMDEEQRNMYMAMIGGKEHVKDLNALMNGLDDSFDSLKDSLSEADGALNEVAETMQDNAKGNLVKLKSAMEEFAIVIYKVIVPVITNFIKRLQGVVDWLNNLSPSAQKIIVVLAGMVAAIGPLLIVIGKMSTGVSALIKLFGPMMTGMVGATGAAGGLSGAIAFLIGPIGIAIAAVTALIAVGVLLYKNWDEVKEFASQLSTTIKNKWDEIKNNVANAWENMKTKTKEGINKVVSTVKDTFSGLVSAVRNIGINIVTGLWNGIAEKVTWLKNKVADFAGGITRGIKGALGISSPSKVMRDQIGKNIALGVADGITENAKKVSEAAKKMFEDSKRWIDDRKYFNELSFQEELAAWEWIQAKYKEGTEERKAAEREIYRLKQEINKKSFENSKKWIDERKYYGELSLTEELAAWERVQARYMQGSEERKTADREVFRLKKEIYNGLKAAADDYYAKAKEINENLIQDEQKLIDVYNQEVKARAGQIMGFTGLFGEVSKESVSGNKLVSNLKGQVKYMEDWAKNIEKLSKRGIDEGLLEELRKMGPSAGNELAALVKLSDKKLQQYEDLWRIKGEIAHEQAVLELEGLREDTQYQIEQLRREANRKLDRLSKDFVGKIQDIRKGTETEFEQLSNSMPKMGENIITGLMQGLDSMSKPLYEKAREIAEGVADIMADALGIQSPSRVMRDRIGKMIGAGLAEGIWDSKRQVDAAIGALNVDIQGSGSDMSAGLNSSVIKHEGTIRVEGINDQGALMGVVDIVMSQLRREVRLA